MTLTLEFEMDDASEAMMMAHQLAKRFGSVRIIIKEDMNANE